MIHNTGANSWVSNGYLTVDTATVIKRIETDKQHILENIVLLITDNVVTINYGLDDGTIEKELFKFETSGSITIPFNVPLKRDLKLPVNKALIIKSTINATAYCYVIEGKTV